MAHRHQFSREYLITLEEFDEAVEFFDRTLAVVPAFPDALLGKVRALTYLGRHEDALVTVDQLLALERWLVGDARYWRALNERSSRATTRRGGTSSSQPDWSSTRQCPSSPEPSHIAGSSLTWPSRSSTSRVTRSRRL